ncbi:ATP-grasp domain-containing protein [Streptomyces rimosus]|uniref:ATP-grasp domain-containing protein n=1 Tax=Streptomyces rimosus TaxID=1927 RepID=UPI001F2B3E4F|nr:ATP-grasp domain-containing protein [Streptomyces rimosus]
MNDDAAMAPALHRPTPRPRAFVLLGGLKVILRNWRYLTGLEERGIVPLVLTSEQWREECLRQMASGERPGSLIADAGFVPGTVGVEGGFTGGVVAQVMAWRERYDIVGVFAAGEMLVEQTGIVADLLGLPSPGLRATRVCRDKHLQRAYLAEWSPRALAVPPGGRDDVPYGEIAFPVVLKPTGRRESSGVQVVGDRDRLRALLRSTEYSPGETLLIEDQVRGQEYSVESLVQDGKIVFESVTHKRTNEEAGDHFVELGHTVPAPPTAGSERLLAANQSVVERLAVENGIVHTELRLADDGRPVLMEVAVRTPGDGLLPLYHLATGRPMEPDILRIALGEPVTRPEPARYARQVYLETPHGILRDVTVHPALGVEPVWAANGQPWPDLAPGRPGDPAALRAVIVLKRPGTRVGPLTESGDRVVTFLIDAPTSAELDRLEAEVRASIEVLTTPHEKGTDTDVDR